jgi:hypothetical protein
MYFSHCVWCLFQMQPLYQRIYYLNKQLSKYVCIYLDDEWAPQVKIATRASHVVLKRTQWSELVKFDEYKSGVHNLGDSRHNLFMYCGRFIRLECNTHQVVLLKPEWSCLMKLASACLNSLIERLAAVNAGVLKWCRKCLHYKTYCKPPLTDVIDFRSLYNELMLMYQSESCQFYDCPW